MFVIEKRSHHKKSEMWDLKHEPPHGIGRMIDEDERGMRGFSNRGDIATTLRPSRERLLPCVIRGF
jgi:hypothetical protein